MSVRTRSFPLGRDFTLRVNKTDAETPVYVLIGCAKSIDYGGAKEVLTANCYAGKQKATSGDDADYDLSVTGFSFIYPDAGQAANVSALDVEGYMNSGILKKYQYAAPHVGDPIRTFDAIVSNFRQTGEVNGIAEYSFTLTVSGIPVLTEQV